MVYTYAPAKKTYRKKNNYRPRKSKKSNKMTYKKINRMIENKIYKTAETGRIYKYCDEQQMSLQTGNAKLLTNISADAGNWISPPATGNGVQDRTGNSINPVSFNWKGHIKISGATNLSENRKVQVRIVAYFYKQGNNVNNTLTDLDILRYGNNVVGLFNDFRDMYADFNWSKIRPFYDRTVTLTPAFLKLADDNVTNLGNFYGNGNDMARINIKHKFKKGTVLSCEDSDADDWKKNNIGILMMCRNANDDYTTSTLNLEVQGLGDFSYKDI